MRRLRERRRQAIEADPDEPLLRVADDLLLPAVEAAVEALGLGPEDAAAAQLARQYARRIDCAKDPSYAMRWLGPELLRALGELGATPVSRAKMPAKPVPERSTWLDDMRRARVTPRLRHINGVNVPRLAYRYG